MQLTRKQKEVLDYIKDYIQAHELSPSYSEIQEYFGLKSKGSVHDYIRYLKRAGLLDIDPYSHRGLRPLEPGQEQTPRGQTEIPLLGKVAAGAPLEVMSHLENAETVQVPTNLIGRGNYFALRVQGQSMIDDGIFENDLLVVKSARTAHNGETVVALINGGATVKRFQQKNNRIELHPANAAFKPIIIKESTQEGDFKIQGIVVGLFRSF